MWGPTCDSADRLGTASLPRLSPNDWVIYREVGDYNIELSTSSFNGFGQPDEVYCCDYGDHELLINILSDTFEFSIQ